MRGDLIVLLDEKRLVEFNELIIQGESQFSATLIVMVRSIKEETNERAVQKFFEEGAASCTGIAPSGEGKAAGLCTRALRRIDAWRHARKGSKTGSADGVRP
jgi:hypothetical protein